MSVLSQDRLEQQMHVVGVFGAEGAAIARFLHAQGAKDVVLHDLATKDEAESVFHTNHEALTPTEQQQQLQELLALPYKWQLGEAYLTDIDLAEVIFVPQSWFRYEQNKPLLELAKTAQDHVEFSSITKLYSDLVPCNMLAVSGSSGKSSVAKLLADICSRHTKTWFTGNDRLNVQILDKIEEMTPDDLCVLEVSNRQLLIPRKKPFHITALTNLRPTHLDDHGDFESYIDAKLQLFSGQTAEHVAILNADDPNVSQLVNEISAFRAFVSLQRPLEEGAYVKGGDFWIRHNNREYKLCSVREFPLPGPHNQLNALIASLMAFHAGVPTKLIREALLEAKGIPHRLEFVREVHGIKYYEDSAACNPDGPRVAVQSFSQPIVLMMGGTRPVQQEGEFLDAMRAIASARMRAVVLYGAVAHQLETELVQVVGEQRAADVFHIQRADTMKEAFQQATQLARKGDVVVLSPGCESFGEFKEYRHRAQVFTELVHKLAETE